MINRLLIGLSIAGAVGVGAVGVALGQSGTLFGDEAASAAVAEGALPYFICPDSGRLGELRSGDRVYLTGRDESGDWVRLRSPQDGGGEVWVNAASVGLDEETDLPVATCETVDGQFESADGVTTTTEAPAEPAETETPEEPEEPEAPTTSTSPSSTTSTTRPSTTTSSTTSTTRPPTTTSSTTSTTRPSTTTSSTTTTSTTTPTTQPAPVIGNINRSPGTIVEEWAGTPNMCGGPKTSSISVPVSNATSVTMSWSVGGSSGLKAMSGQGGVYSAVLGPFDEHTVDARSSVSVTITAQGPGGERTRQTAVTLDDCYWG